jgi:mRNA interferase MazF
MQSILRGNIYWVDLDPTFGSQQRGRRPCLVMTSDKLNSKRKTIGVVPLSSSPLVAPPIVVSVPSLGKDSVAICDQLRAVDKSRFGDYILTLTKSEMLEIERCIKLVFVLN